MPKFNNLKIMKIHESRLKEVCKMLDSNLIRLKALQMVLSNLRSLHSRHHPVVQGEISRIRNELSDLQEHRVGLINDRKNHHSFFVRYKRLWLQEV